MQQANQTNTQPFALVSLIGAGPGDPELISLKALKALEAADVIIYDYLAHRSFMQYASSQAECIFVGKKGFTQHVSQDEINELLVQKAKEPKVRRVARLKGGDPFVFGRGGEEALALAAEGISFEVIPGISSGVAAPAYAGIPVTHRGLASAVTFVTGHEDPEKNSSALDWAKLAQGSDTLCFYMGVRNIRLIADRLQEHGRAADEPVALVRWGTTPEQEVLVSTLAEVAADVERTQFKAPAIIVVGQVVSLQRELSWFDPSAAVTQGETSALPLAGRRFVVTRSRTQASKLVRALEAQGASVFEFPTIRIAEPSDKGPLEQSAGAAANKQYDWVVFTSVNGVKAFFDCLHEQGYDSRDLAGTKFAAIGPATAQELKSQGIIANSVPGEYRAEGVIEELFSQGVGANARVLLARAKEARNILPWQLLEAGVKLEVVEAYQTLIDQEAPVEELLRELEAQTIDGLCFSASSTVHNFVELVGAKRAERLCGELDRFSIGPITSQTLSDKGLSPQAEARVYTIDGLVECICEYYQEQSRRAALS